MTGNHHLRKVILRINCLLNCHSMWLIKKKSMTSRKLGFPGNSTGKESACNAGDPSSIPESGRSAGEGNGCPLQYSGLENSMDYSSWVAESDTIEQLSLSLFKKAIIVISNGQLQ